MGIHPTFLDYMVFNQTWFWLTYRERHTDKWKCMDVHIQFWLNTISTLINPTNLFQNCEIPDWSQWVFCSWNEKAKYCKTYCTIHSNWCLGTDSHGMLLKIGCLGASLLWCWNPYYAYRVCLEQFKTSLWSHLFCYHLQAIYLYWFSDYKTGDQFRHFHNISGKHF